VEVKALGVSLFHASNLLESTAFFAFQSARLVLLCCVANQDRIEFYSENAGKLADQYSKMDRAKVHAISLEILDSPEPLSVLDAGCGSGADAKWMASAFGHHVVAVEPSTLIEQAIARNSHENLEYVRDHLPDLPLIAQRGEQFDVVMSSAVLQELGPEERAIALETMVNLVKPGGALIISYPSPASREGQQTVPDSEVADILEKILADPNSPMAGKVEKSTSQLDTTGRTALNGEPLTFQDRIVRVFAKHQIQMPELETGACEEAKQAV
jgi:2-polyprenyl-3-methyl-5-hydroxy-6-metoxy-1,4-benzoquinol methylase